MSVCETAFSESDGESVHGELIQRELADLALAGSPRPVGGMNNNTTQSIRETYDRLADEYARQFVNELQSKPLDREVLGRFAREVAYRGQACDMGCGPGHIARYLRNVGVNVFGLDLSPRMVERARELNPDVSFREGSMMALDFPDGVLAGIVAFYAIVNIPKESLLSVFREMARVLQPSGLLLLAFHIGDEILHKEELWGQQIAMDWFFFPTLEIRQLLEAAGFVMEDVIEREPYAPEVEYQSRRAYIFARKPRSGAENDGAKGGGMPVIPGKNG